jgi:hypothetical protein
MFILSSITTLSLGLLIGVELSVALFINPVVDSLATLDPSGQSRLTRLFATRLGHAMPFWYAANLLLLLGQCILHRGHAEAPLLWFAAALWAVVILVTVLFLVPINNRMMMLDGAMNAQAQHDHRTWDSLHRLRILALAAAAFCALIAMHA